MRPLEPQPRCDSEVLPQLLLMPSSSLQQDSVSCWEVPSTGPGLV